MSPLPGRWCWMRVARRVALILFLAGKVLAVGRGLWPWWTSLVPPLRGSEGGGGFVTTGSIPVGHYTHGNMILPRFQR